VQTQQIVVIFHISIDTTKTVVKINEHNQDCCMKSLHFQTFRKSLISI